MPFTTCSTTVSYISALVDLPNDAGVSPLTATQLKTKFDQAGADLKDYINDSLIPELEAADALNVKTTGSQTVSGVKTFEASPVVPTPTTDYQAAPKKYVDDNSPVLQGSIHDQFLGEDATDIKARFASHLADNAKHVESNESEFIDRGIDVKKYNVSGSNLASNGNLSGNILTVIDAKDFKVNHGIRIEINPGQTEIITLDFTGSGNATANGYITITLNGFANVLPVVLGETPQQIVDKIAAMGPTTDYIFTNYSFAKNGLSIVFTCQGKYASTSGHSFTANGTGITASIVTTQAGIDKQFFTSKITEINGLNFTLRDAYAGTVNNCIVTHNDTEMLQYLLDNYGTLIFPKGIYNVTGLQVNGGNRLIGVKVNAIHYVYDDIQYASIIRLLDGSANDVIKNKVDVTKVDIEFIEIDGNKANQSAKRHGIYYIPHSNANVDSCFKIYDCFIHDMNGSGILFEHNANGNRVHRNTIIKCNGDGIRMKASDSSILDNTIGLLHYGAGIYLDSGAWQSIVIGNAVFWCLVSLQCMSCKNIKVLSNIFETAYKMSAYINAGSGIIIGNNFNGTSHSADGVYSFMDVTAVNDFIISNNHFGNTTALGDHSLLLDAKKASYALFRHDELSTNFKNNLIDSTYVAYASVNGSVNLAIDQLTHINQSTAADVATLKTDFNNLLTQLQNIGFMQSV